VSLRRLRCSQRHFLTRCGRGPAQVWSALLRGWTLQWGSAQTLHVDAFDMTSRSSDRPDRSSTGTYESPGMYERTGLNSVRSHWDVFPPLTRCRAARGTARQWFRRGSGDGGAIPHPSSLGRSAGGPPPRRPIRCEEEAPAASMSTAATRRWHSGGAAQLSARLQGARIAGPPRAVPPQTTLASRRLAQRWTKAPQRRGSVNIV